MKITAKTVLCFVIGDPVQHSLSPQMHNAAYAYLGIDDQFVYAASHVKPEELEDAVKGVRALNIRGVSVTVPHKSAIIHLLNDIDPTAEKIGAVNTVVNDNGKLTGYNTDWQGVVNALEKVTVITDKKIAVLGAGGAARGAVYGLVEHGGNVTIFNRTVEKAKELAEEFECSYATMADAEQIVDMDIIFNATSVGLHPHENESPLHETYLRSNHIVFDAVYAPYETTLLKEAKAKGATTIHGVDMLLYQAVEQFKLYTGYNAPTDIMRKVLIERVNEL
jgi:shikimate dehydrogenase